MAGIPRVHSVLNQLGQKHLLALAQTLIAAGRRVIMGFDFALLGIIILSLTAILLAMSL